MLEFCLDHKAPCATLYSVIGDKLMPVNLENYLVIGISSRALFDLEKENKIFEEEGLESYIKFQIEHQDDLLKPGTGFHLVEKILKLNRKSKAKRKSEVIILSRNIAETALRITKSIENYKLDIIRSAWTGGTPITRYLKPFKVDLFLSAHQEDVQTAINAGIASARVYKFKKQEISDDKIKNGLIKIAFDGDAVIFSDESEKIYVEQGLEAFLEHEKSNAKQPLPEGPFAKFLKTMSYLQKEFPIDKSPIRLALVTARNSPAHERVIRTLHEWNVRIDETFFLSGVEKKDILDAFGADIFFDDQDVHCASASRHVPTARVPTRNT